MVCAQEDVTSALASRGFREIKQIGEGSFARALLVESADGSRAVCKVIDAAESSKEAEDAAKEGRLLASLRHPFIVRYRDSFFEARLLCIVMDFCEGGELAKYIRRARKTRQRIVEEQVLRWFTQAMLALKYIHEKHILHRDLKPANFFLTKTGSLKMGDFGISKSMACTMACAKTRIGTPYYLSPEVCQEKPYTWPSDIWSMGCVLYELCALQVPFDASSISGLVQKICYGALPALPEFYSGFLQQLCYQMLDREPHNRPSADEVLQNEYVQNMVRKMLEEVRRLQADPRSDTQVGRYRKNDEVEYYSCTSGEWLPASVLETDDEGRIVLDIRPRLWILPKQQAVRIRPRSLGTVAHSRPDVHPSSRSSSTDGRAHPSTPCMAPLPILQSCSPTDGTALPPAPPLPQPARPPPITVADAPTLLASRPLASKRDLQGSQLKRPAPSSSSRSVPAHLGHVDANDEQLERVVARAAPLSRSPSAGRLERLPGEMPAAVPLRRSPSLASGGPRLTPIGAGRHRPRPISADGRSGLGTPPTRPASADNGPSPGDLKTTPVVTPLTTPSNEGKKGLLFKVPPMPRLQGSERVLARPSNSALAAGLAIAGGGA